MEKKTAVKVNKESEQAKKDHFTSRKEAQEVVEKYNKILQQKIFHTSQKKGPVHFLT